MGHPQHAYMCVCVRRRFTRCDCYMYKLTLTKRKYFSSLSFLYFTFVVRFLQKKKRTQIKVICIKLKLFCVILYEFESCSFTLIDGRISRVLENRDPTRIFGPESGM
jgi:hypothetical protein